MACLGVVQQGLEAGFRRVQFAGSGREFLQRFFKTSGFRGLVQERFCLVSRDQQAQPSRLSV